MFSFLTGKSFELPGPSEMRYYKGLELYKESESIFTNDVTLLNSHPYINHCNGLLLHKKIPSQSFYHNMSKELDENICSSLSTEIDSEDDLATKKAIFKTIPTVPSTSASSNASALCWNYTEDVAGKKGWINEGCKDAAIYFKIKFGSVPTLTVVYLSTYIANTGKAIFFLSEPIGPNQDSPEKLKYTNIGKIDALRGSGEWNKYSLSVAHVFHPSNYSSVNSNTMVNSVSASIMLPNSHMLLKVLPDYPEVAPEEAAKADPNLWNKKFKIISVSSC